MTTTIVCNATHFDISPESIFFAGEPGGIIGMTVDKVNRQNTTWKLAPRACWATPSGARILAAKWTRPATPGSDAPAASGKLELERVFTPSQPEVVNTEASASSRPRSCSSRPRAASRSTARPPI